MVIAGDDKGKIGNVLEVFRKRNRAIVENINLMKKHMKPTNDNPGGITEIAGPVHLSNLMLIDPKSGETTRIGRKDVNGKLKACCYHVREAVPIYIADRYGYGRV